MLRFFFPLTLAFAGFAEGRQCEVSLPPENFIIARTYGFALAKSGEHLLVGAPESTGLAQSSGSVTAWRKTGSTWMYEALLLPVSGVGTGSNHSRFGRAIDIDGNRALIGAPIGGNGSGRAFYFEWDSAGGWSESFMVLPQFGQAGFFGGGVALYGNRFVITGGGGAHVYRLTAAGWVSEGDLTDLIPSFFGQFSYGGTYVDMGPETIAFVSSDGVTALVLVFDLTPFGWSYAQTLFLPDFVAAQAFARSISLDGDRLAIGAPGMHFGSDDTGYVFVFERFPSGWEQVAMLESPDAEPNARFGASVSLSGETLAVAATHENQLDNSSGLNLILGDVGAVYVYEDTGGGWLQIGAEVTPLSPVGGGHFGTGLFLDDEELIVGAPDWIPGSGMVTTYERGEHGWSCGFLDYYCFCTEDEAPCSNFSTARGCRNGTGQGALLRVLGTPDTTADDLQFVLLGLPSSEPGILFMGSGAGREDFGNGERCVFDGPGTIFRFPVVTSDLLGELILGPGLAAQSPITAGSTWHFQYWYRDSAGPCGRTFNFTNAAAVFFAP